MTHLFFALLLCFVTSATAAEFEVVEVQRDADTYTVHARATIDAGFDSVRHVITDYSHLHWITGAVLKAEVLDRPAADIAIIFVRSRACFGIFCKTLEQVQRADSQEMERIVFVALPEYSDVVRGRSEWQLLQLEGGRTQVTWDMLMEPDFWVPPLIGAGMIKDGLAREGRDMIRGIEKLAREREARK